MIDLWAIDDADLDVYQFRMLCHIARVGVCWKTIRTLARDCKMSTGKASVTKKSLEEAGYIVMAIDTKTGNLGWSIANCFKRSPNEQLQHFNRSPHEQRSPHEHETGCNRSPHEPKETTINIKTTTEAREREDALSLAWKTAVNIANWFRSKTGQSTILLRHLENGRADRLVSDYIEPANQLWIRLDRDAEKAQQAIWSKYQDMLRDQLRPRRLSAIVPQIFGDLDTAELPQQPPAKTAVPNRQLSNAEAAAIDYVETKRRFFNEQ